MKGVSAVIAVVLVLMITVSLAAMAYVLLTSVFQQIAGGAGNVTAVQVQAMGTAFSLETAAYSGSNNVTVAIRNTGSVNIDMSTISAYIRDIPVTVTAAGVLVPGGYTTFNVSNATVGAACGQPVKVFAQAGTPQVITVTGGCP